jgi:hypothetical protein
VDRRCSFEIEEAFATEATMRRILNSYTLTPEDRRVQRVWAGRIALLYGAIALIAVAALVARGHQPASNQASTGAAAVVSAMSAKTSVRP